MEIYTRIFHLKAYLPQVRFRINGDERKANCKESQCKHNGDIIIAKLSEVFEHKLIVPPLPQIILFDGRRPNILRTTQELVLETILVFLSAAFPCRPLSRHAIHLDPLHYAACILIVTV